MRRWVAVLQGATASSGQSVGDKAADTSAAFVPPSVG